MSEDTTPLMRLTPDEPEAPPPPLARYGQEVIPHGLSIRAVLSEVGKVRASTWSMYNRTIKGHPYTFDVRRLITGLDPKAPESVRKQLLLRHRPFLVQPLNDQHPHKVYKKARQVGVSELSVTEALWFLDVHPRTKLIYTFPREKQLTDFSTTRIVEAMAESPRMADLFQGTNGAFLKCIGGSSYLFLRSAWESNLGEGVDADVVIFDEKDRMKDGIEVAFKESLSSSRFGWLREVSTPTLPGRGVDASYMHSDQHEWHVRCTKCNMWQTVEWPDNVIQMRDLPPGSREVPEGTYEYLCRKERCRGPLDRLTGQWIPRYPSRKAVRGYHIPQTICPWVSADTLMYKRVETRFQQLWENYVLARTSAGETVLITDVHWTRATAGHKLLTGRTDSWDQFSVGVDWGHLNWVLVTARNKANKRRYIVGMAVVEDDPRMELESAKKIEAYIAPFEPDIVVADAGFGKDRNAHLLRKYPGRFYACYYNPSDKGSRTFQPQWSDNQFKVLADRTLTIKETCRIIRDAELGLPAWDMLMHVMKSHFEALALLRVEEDGDIYETIESTKDDHFVHALAYAYLGFDKLNSVPDSSFTFF